MNSPYILGLWDGHDSGAALVRGDQIVCAVNEERLTRRKLEIAFPSRSIQACLQTAGIALADLGAVACSTTDVAKTLTRLRPQLKEQYYRIRRRQILPTPLRRLSKSAKYRITELPPLPGTSSLSRHCIQRELARIGVSAPPLHLYDHHYCHATAAAFCSGFQEALILTLDGLGDGLSGTISVKAGPQLTRLARIHARHSLGILFEHVTNLLNMRELEDEGKVMAMAGYAYPVPDEQNPILQLVSVSGLDVTFRCPSRLLFKRLHDIFWKTPAEQFAFMAQRAIEISVLQLVENAVRSTGNDRLAFSGGIANNVKLNQRLRCAPFVRDCYVFPHMGDGGLALGAAMAANYELNGVASYHVPSLQLGPATAFDRVPEAGRSRNLNVTAPPRMEEAVADMLCHDKIVLWVQGRMEYGPRALGGRSILARPDSFAIRDRLNLAMKKRVWYQPFCPSMLLEDAERVFADWRGTPNAFMTTAYLVKPEFRDALRGVLHVDHTCRPQCLTTDNGVYGRLLAAVKKRLGLGALLNTSFNIHGEPIVADPADAIAAFLKMEADALVIDHWLLTKGTT